MLDDLNKLRVINFVNQRSLDGLKVFLDERGFSVFELDGGHIQDKQSFFIESVKVFPQDPPLGGGNDNWDAFTDSVWGGLANLGKERVAFIWTNAETMLEHGLQDLLIASRCFEQIASEMATTKYGIPRPVMLIVFLVGEGNNFRTFSPDKGLAHLRTG